MNYKIGILDSSGAIRNSPALSGSERILEKLNSTHIE